MRRLLLPVIAIFFAACSTASHPFSTPTPVVPQFPDTHLGRMGAEWIAAINSLQQEPIEKFVAANYARAALRRQSAPLLLRLFRNLQTQSGGVDIIEIVPSAGPRPMTMLVRSRRGNRYARVIMGSDHDEPEKLGGTGVDRSDPPDAERQRYWPAAARSDEAITAAVRREIGRRAADGTFSGVVLLAHGDRVLLHESRGFADAEAKTPNQLDTVFHLASVGKLFTAVSIAQLVESGRLSFDSKLIDVLPDYPNREGAQKITIGQLLTHSAGLGTFFESPGFVRGRSYKSAFEELDVFKDERLFFEPGTRWRYSNAGYAVLGAVIERLSGQPYIDYLRQHVFAPAGMTRTYADLSAATAPAVATLYEQSDDDPLGMEPFIPDRTLKNSRPDGFGGGFSNTLDLFRYVRALRGGKLVSPAMLKTMTSIQVDTDGRHTRFWNYGFEESAIDGMVVRGHTGGGRADVRMLWDDDYTLIVLTNVTPPPASAFGSDIMAFVAAQVRKTR